MLVQKQNGVKRVISYASRSLSRVERRYSQTEKEALGIVWLCERFHAYVYGIHFEIATDHKPLLYIYAPKSKPCARVERWVLRLQSYDFTIKHIPGKQMVADALSRLIGESKLEQTDEAEQFVRFIAQEATPIALKIRDIERESAADEKLSVVRDCVESGHWENCPAEFKPVRNELCVVGKLVLRGWRLVIPESLRKQTVDLGHEGHQGIVKTKERLRSKVWWPGIDRDADRKCRTCHGCQLVGRAEKPEPPKRFDLPSSAWQDTALDLLGPMPDGEYIVAIVDYYSRFFEIDIVKTITSAKMIECLEPIFTRYGYPELLKTDNGAQLISAEFESYLRENGIEHRTSTPLWPQANGEIEKQNRTMLKAMRIAHAEGKDWVKELNRLLLAYRTTPHSTTGVTPAKLMFGREIRSKVPQYSESSYQRELAARDRDAELKQKGKDYADNRRNARECEILVDEKVLMQQQKKGKLSTRFAEKPCVVVQKYGNEVTVRSDKGKIYKRNTAQLKKFHEQNVEPEKDVSQEQPITVDIEQDALSDCDSNDDSVPQESTVKLPNVRRSGRVRRPPAHFSDYELG
ncbi:uncharacterized protein K02A2.6-like [Lineus longissimus]|uniref:uncharacterized protein K02A2.6-like n=1 Tax=Lineus longissimus TaxID=88925 RepID=UPI00315DCA9E